MIDRIRTGLIRVALVTMLVLGMLMPSGQVNAAYHTLQATPTITAGTTLDRDPGGPGG